MALGLLIAISAAGASSVDVDFDTLRRWLVGGLVPVAAVAGQNMVRVLDLGLSVRGAAARLGVSVETVAELQRAGVLTPLPLPGATRFREADIAAYVRKLSSVPITDDLREEIWPSVETFAGTAVSDSPAIEWGKSQDTLERRQAAADARVESEFQQYLTEHYPSPQLTDVGDGLQQFNPNGALTSEQVADQRHAWHKRRQAAAEAKKYDVLHSHNPRGY
jgi:hypothetical protein